MPQLCINCREKLYKIISDYVEEGQIEQKKKIKIKDTLDKPKEKKRFGIF